jgi:hypothetical protein
MEVNNSYREYITWRLKPSFYQEPRESPITQQIGNLEKFWDVDHSFQMVKQQQALDII